MAKMSARSALKEAIKRWGTSAAVRDSGLKRAGTPEARAAAKERVIALNEEIRALEKAGKGLSETRELRKERDAHRGIMWRYRYTVGRIIMGGFAFGVEGEGDTWEECFAKADERARIDRERYASLKKKSRGPARKRARSGA